jgi:low affinity Fe/Cu permease
MLQIELRSQHGVGQLFDTGWTMARKRPKTSLAAGSAAGIANGASASAGPQDKQKAPLQKTSQQKDSRQEQQSWHELFSDMACRTAQLAGHPLAFLTAVTLVLVWALSGPLFGYSDTWQLVINTSTTIVTFLMVFLIQHTQNRDTLAAQLKLAELIIAVKGAENRLATAEDLSEKDLEELHEDYRHRADEALDHLNRRRRQIQQVS